MLKLKDLKENRFTIMGAVGGGRNHRKEIETINKEPNVNITTENTSKIRNSLDGLNS